MSLSQFLGIEWLDMPIPLRWALVAIVLFVTDFPIGPHEPFSTVFPNTDGRWELVSLATYPLLFCPSQIQHHSNGLTERWLAHEISYF